MKVQEYENEDAPLWYMRFADFLNLQRLIFIDMISDSLNKCDL